MCSKDNLTVFLLGLNTLILVSAVVLMLMGLVLLLNSSFNIAYGGVVIGWGIGMLLSAILLAGVGCMSFYGAQHHNKCMLITAAGVAMLVIIMQLSVAVNIQRFTEPDFAIDVIDECLARPNTKFDTDECQAYYKHISTVRLFRLWLTTYRTSIDDELVKQELVGIESDNLCCGFGPAEQCTPGVYKSEVQEISDTLLQDSEDPLGELFGICFQDRTGWYTQQHHCKIPVAPNLNRGCPYVYSVSASCMRAETRPACARIYAEQIRDAISPIASIALILMIFQGLVTIGSCCLCLKRKDHDVLPAPETFVDKAFEKYAIETTVEPKVTPGQVVPEP